MRALQYPAQLQFGPLVVGVGEEMLRRLLLHDPAVVCPRTMIRVRVRFSGTVLWGEKVEGLERNPDLFTHLTEDFRGVSPTAVQQVGDGRDGSSPF
jgi:hypothetical protein